MGTSTYFTEKHYEVLLETCHVRTPKIPLMYPWGYVYPRLGTPNLKGAQPNIFITNEQDTENKLSMSVCDATNWMGD